MKYFTKDVSVSTSRGIEFIDVTGEVKKAVAKSKIKDGLASIFSNHTTAGVKINERCARLQKDMQTWLEDIAPQNKSYKHNETALDNRGNAHSHLMSLLTGISETIPVKDGNLILGTWQSVFFMEFDGPRNSRSFTITVVGE